MLGPVELLVVLLIVLLVFGGSKIHSIARAFGQAVKEFKTASKEKPEDGMTGPSTK